MKRRSDIERKACPECHPQLRLLNKSPFQGQQMKKFAQSQIHISICTKSSLYLPYYYYSPTYMLPVFCENTNFTPVHTHTHTQVI